MKQKMSVSGSKSSVPVSSGPLPWRHCLEFILTSTLSRDISLLPQLWRSTCHALGPTECCGGHRYQWNRMRSPQDQKEGHVSDRNDQEMPDERSEQTVQDPERWGNQGGLLRGSSFCHRPRRWTGLAIVGLRRKTSSGWGSSLNTKVRRGQAQK